MLFLNEPFYPNKSMRPFSKLLLLSLFYIPFFGSAQICADKIEMANKLLEIKEYNQSFQLIQSCAEPTQPVSIRWQAYRVMAIAYLYLGKKDSAQIMSLALLKLNPAYEPDRINNPKEFIRLIKDYNEVKPYTFYSNYFLGSTHTQVHVKEVYGAIVGSKIYSPLLGAQLGAQLGLYINPNFSVDLGVSTLLNRYSIDYDIPDWQLHYMENQLVVQTPLSIQYLVNPQSRLRYGFRLGYYKQYLITSENSFASTYLPNNTETVLNRELSSDRRNRWTNGYIFGLTMLYKTRSGHVNFQGSFTKSTTQYNKPETRFDDTHLLYQYFYLDDNISLDNFTLSIGYTHLFHKTVKKYD